MDMFREVFGEYWEPTTVRGVRFAAEPSSKRE
jgi:hypothetical protein